MALVVRRPVFRPTRAHMHHHMHHLRNAFLDSWGQSNGFTYAPRVDLRDQDDKYIVDVDLPGFTKEEITVDVTPKFIDVIAEHRVEEVEENEGEEHENGYLYKERASYRFSRRIRLPSSVDIEQVISKFEEGTLSLELPKAENKDKRRLELQ